MTSRLADIAAVAKVSEATVSRVLNGRPGVAKSTRDAVLSVVDLLGYDRPSRLRRKSAGLVGLITPELTNPIFPGMAQVIEQALVGHGFTPVLCTQAAGGAHEDDYVQMLLDRHVAGIIFVCGVHANSDCDASRYNCLRERRVPIVLVNGYLDGVDAPFISTDDAKSAEIAFAHLVEQGHRCIGLAVGPARYIGVSRKIAGFRAASAAMLGVQQVDDLIVHASFSVEGGSVAAQALLRRGVTGIICASDLMALGAISAARADGLEVPRDVSVVGYDDSLLMEFTSPPLTTVRQNIGAIGQAAVSLLLDEINGRHAPRAELVFRPELVVRASSGPAPERQLSAGRRKRAAHSAAAGRNPGAPAAVDAASS